MPPSPEASMQAKVDWLFSIQSQLAFVLVAECPVRLAPWRGLRAEHAAVRKSNILVDGVKKSIYLCYQPMRSIIRWPTAETTQMLHCPCPWQLSKHIKRGANNVIGRDVITADVRSSRWEKLWPRWGQNCKCNDSDSLDKSQDQHQHSSHSSKSTQLNLRHQQQPTLPAVTMMLAIDSS
jgi:hypothetical protein